MHIYSGICPLACRQTTATAESFHGALKCCEFKRTMHKQVYAYLKRVFPTCVGKKNFRVDVYIEKAVKRLQATKQWMYVYSTSILFFAKLYFLSTELCVQVDEKLKSNHPSSSHSGSAHDLAQRSFGDGFRGGYQVYGAVSRQRNIFVNTSAKTK